VKPTLLGLPAGAFLGDALARRARAPIGLAVAATAILALLASAASGGLLFRHVAASNAQPLTWGAWLEHVPSRLPFFAPLLALAGFRGWRDRRASGSAIGLGALLVSTGWVCASLAKTGSSSNYWMEPCLAAVALVACAAPGPPRFGDGSVAHAATALACVLYADVAAIGGSIVHAQGYRDDAAFVGRLRGICGQGVIAADEAGVELAANGRILTTTYQMAYLVRTGRYPAEPWARDLVDPHVACVVEHANQYDLVGELRNAIDRAYVERENVGGWRLSVRRPTSAE
jgi:hypothetical protein